ncbi:olfactory receptor-like protein COR9 [Pantherophis guttatus]|uniref:Olfactory receptor-like protein COR9 n=1 Tax=Pantherophis guttatus TaxID=94885 RepID=A0ABM3Z8B4_PANGU|nr:olfactory receptor-like protein COR9 [Pantherophis guttatus]
MHKKCMTSYAVLCEPLHYSQLMSKEVRVPLATASWILGMVDSAIHTALATDLVFCGANEIHHISCDVPPLLKIACSDTYVNEMALHTASAFVGLSPFLLVVISYIYILSTILEIRSSTGRRKTFSTCAAHLITVIVYFGMADLNYNRPSVRYSLGVDTLILTVYCIITPMLNPLIYSLQNKAVKGALQMTIATLPPVKSKKPGAGIKFKRGYQNLVLLVGLEPKGGALTNGGG